MVCGCGTRRWLGCPLPRTPSRHLTDLAYASSEVNRIADATSQEPGAARWSRSHSARICVGVRFRTLRTAGIMWFLIAETRRCNASADSVSRRTKTRRVHRAEPSRIELDLKLLVAVRADAILVRRYCEKRFALTPWHSPSMQRSGGLASKISCVCFELPPNDSFGSGHGSPQRKHGHRGRHYGRGDDLMDKRTRR
jgi:hypothetical protein